MKYKPLVFLVICLFVISGAIYFLKKSDSASTNDATEIYKESYVNFLNENKNELEFVTSELLKIDSSASFLLLMENEQLVIKIFEPGSNAENEIMANSVLVEKMLNIFKTNEVHSISISKNIPVIIFSMILTPKGRRIDLNFNPNNLNVGQQTEKIDDKWDMRVIWNE